MTWELSYLTPASLPQAQSPMVSAGISDFLKHPIQNLHWSMKPWLNSLAVKIFRFSALPLSRLSRPQQIEFLDSTHISLTRKFLGFPGGAVDKNLSGDAGDMGLIPIQEDSTYQGATKPMRHNYWACALEPGSHDTEPTCCNYSSPRALESTLRNKRIHWNKKPTQHSWE